MSSPAPVNRSRTLLLALVCVAVVSVGLFAASPGLRRVVMRLITPVPTEPLLAAVAAGDESTVYAWTLHGPNFDERTPEGLDALLLAAKNGLTEITALLIGAGANVYSVDPAGNSAIHLAAAANHIYTIESLYLHGAPLDARNKANETPLHVAARANLPKAARMLVEAGADPHLRVDIKTASSPLLLAAAAKNWDVVRTLAAMRLPYTLLEAVQFGDIEEIDRVMTHRPGEASDAAGARSNGPDAIQSALIAGQIESVKAMQRHGAMIPYSTNSGIPIMVILMRNGRRHMIEYMMEQGISIDASTVYNNFDTVLHVQAKEGTPDNIAWLIKKGANPNALNTDGNTPLHIAAGYGKAELVQALVEHGADLNIRNKKNQTPLELAQERKRQPALAYFATLASKTP
jgi:ankyrin repeat protein